MSRPAITRRGSYGLDAPYLLAIPLVLVVVAALEGAVTRSPWPFVGAALVICCSGFALYASARGKFSVWAELLDELDLRGDEQILDLGCGRGAVLLTAAQHLSSGRAVGVDLWRHDQSGNSLKQTRRNAVCEGVAEKVELFTADIAALPFLAESFDAVVSSLVLHNLSPRGQKRALAEAVRVLRPGGRLLVADLGAVGRYRRRLDALGMDHVAVRNLGWRMWWTGPWLPTLLVSARKPAVDGQVSPASAP
jgi:SAM-dependent methyltransferase